MPDFAVKQLSPSTWPDFAALVERHNGVWGGCWCMAFHPEGVGRGTLAVFEEAGFERTRRIGKNHWVVTKAVAGKRKAGDTTGRSTQGADE